MPVSCSAYGCKNRRTSLSKHRGITFHQFPKNPELRKAWILAFRRMDFRPSNKTVLCSNHFNKGDFDRTGQTVRLREGVIPCVFASFPNHLKKKPVKARSTRTSRRALETIKDHVPAPKPPKPSVSDHHYALNPDQVKKKLSDAQARIEELERQLRNAKDRERRQKQTLKSLLEQLEDKGMISEEIQIQLLHESDEDITKPDACVKASAIAGTTPPDKSCRVPKIPTVLPAVPQGFLKRVHHLSTKRLLLISATRNSE